ncbi:MAG: hypothetical protein Q9201_008001 [Fulgogasparrea decipioides]
MSNSSLSSTVDPVPSSVCGSIPGPLNDHGQNSIPVTTSITSPTGDNINGPHGGHKINEHSLAAGPQAPSGGFLKLPLELRQQIYRHLLPSAVKISQHRPIWERLYHPWALTYVCRQIRHEVLVYFYSTATFCLDLLDRNGGKTREAYIDWMDSLDPDLAARIKKMVILGEVEVMRESKWERHYTAYAIDSYRQRRTVQKFASIALTVEWSRVKHEFKVEARVLRHREEEKIEKETSERNYDILIPLVGPMGIGRAICEAREVAQDIEADIGRRTSATAVGLGTEGIKALVKSVLRYNTMDFLD